MKKISIILSNSFLLASFFNTSSFKNENVQKIYSWQRPNDDFYSVINNATELEIGFTVGVRVGDKNPLPIEKRARSLRVRFDEDYESIRDPLVFNKWSGRLFSTHLFTFKLPFNFTFEEFPIFYMSSEGSIAKTSWGSREYMFYSISDYFNEKNIFDVGVQGVVYKTGHINSIATKALYDTKDWGAFSTFRTWQKIGLSYFTYQKTSYFQILLHQYAERWGGSDNGGIWFKFPLLLNLFKNHE